MLLLLYFYLKWFKIFNDFFCTAKYDNWKRVIPDLCYDCFPNSKTAIRIGDKVMTNKNAPVKSYLKKYIYIFTIDCCRSN